jgi:hypothetical protein
MLMRGFTSTSNPASHGEIGGAKLLGTADDRTTPLGLFNFAESYREAADKLAMELARPRFDSPPRYLFYHSIELYLKAFLRSTGLTVREIKDKSHGFCALCAACTERGLSPDDEDRQVIGLINAQGNYIRARYIETGPMTVATLEALSRTGASLAAKIGGALKASGAPAREPRPSPLKPDSQQISADLSEEDRLIIEIAGELIDGDIEPRNAQYKG